MEVIKDSFKERTDAKMKGQKTQQEIQNDLQSIPNTELEVLRCACGSYEWKTLTLLYRIPMLHPKNGTGQNLNRPQQVCVCGKCGKVNPDHLNIKDRNYIDNLPEELK